MEEQESEVACTVHRHWRVTEREVSAVVAAAAAEVSGAQV